MVLYQIIRTIRKIIKSFYLEIEFVKIQAHQDDIKDTYNLTFLERENIACDLEAKALITNTSLGYYLFLFKLSSSHISTTKDEVVNSLKALYKYYSKISTMKYLATKLALLDMSQVDWYSRSIAFKRFPTHLHI